MLNKLLSLLGLITKSTLAQALAQAEQDRIEAIEHEQKHYKESLDILEKAYEVEIGKANTTNLALKKENDELLEDVALALLGQKTKGADSTIKVEEVKAPKHQYSPKKPTVRSAAAQMIKKLEEKLAAIPDGARGTGGIDVLIDGKVILKNFYSKSDLEKILKDAKAGKLEIVEQAGLQ